MNDRDPRFDNSIIEEDAPSQLPQAANLPSGSFVPEKIESFKNKFVRHLHLFDAFCEEPHAVNFQTQENDEKILLFLRKSQIINLPWILFSVFLAIAPLIFLSIKDSLFPFVIPLNVFILYLIFYYLFAITYTFTNFIIWYFNAALITNKRIIDIDYHQLVYKDVAETKLNLVQDISYRQTSVFSNLFNFGHVLIQTAGTIENFEFDDLPKPGRIEEIVENLIGKGGRPYES